MAIWANRLVLGAAVVVMAPLTARITLSPGSGSENSSGASVGKRQVNALDSRAPRAQEASAPAGQDGGAVDTLGPQGAARIAKLETGREFRETLCGFLEPYGGSTPQEAAEQLCTNPPEGKVDAMIAILPDPVHTHLALRFDRAVDDLQNTAQQLGWLFHRAWLPWPEAQTDNKTLRFQQREVDGAMLKMQEQQPGLLLFRRGSAARPLVVLVVGDTPTAGVNTAQFQAAVRVWMGLHAGLPPCGGAACPPGTVRRMQVLGPSFTGSVDSLQTLLRDNIEELTVHGTQCPDAPLSIDVASGTMTSNDKLGSLTGLFQCGISTAAVSFAADTSYVRSYLLRFLDGRLHPNTSKVAELSEDESGFGASVGTELLPKVKLQLQALEKSRRGTSTKSATCPDRNADGEPGDCAAGGDASAAPNGEAGQVSAQMLADEIARQQNLESFLADFQARRGDLRLKFPRGISLLRQAYAQNGILGFGGGATNSPRTELQLNLQEHARDDDAVLPFAGSQSAASMESRMAQLAATLEQKQVEVAVLSATDVLDDIFVARYLKAHAPGVTVVILDADVLFLRGGTDASMEGIYVVSPYPLIPQNVAWSRDAGNPLGDMPTLPPSQGDKGTANAVRFLLCGRNETGLERGTQEMCGWAARRGFDGPYLWMNEYEPPFPVPAEARNEFKLRPPLWLSVIEHGGFQPLSLIDVDQEDANFPAMTPYNLPRLGDVAKRLRTEEEPVAKTSPAGMRDEPMVQMHACALVLGLLLGLHGWAVCWCRLNRQFFWTYAAADVEPWAMRLLVQAGLGLVGIYGLSLLLLHEGDGFHMQSARFQAILVLMQIAAAATNGVAAWRAAANLTNDMRQKYVAVLAMLVSLLFVVAADSFLWRAFAPAAHTVGERNFFFYRFAYPLNGASPLLPLLLLLASVALWLREWLSKLVFSGCRIPKLPSEGMDVRCPCGERTRSLESLLGMPLWRAGTGMNWLKLCIAAVATAFVCAVVRLSGRWGPHSLAYTGFDGLVDVLALGVAIVVVHNLLVAFLAWRLLKHEVLMPLKQSPLRWGFNWVQGFSWKRLWTSPEGFSPEAQLEFVMRNVEAERRGQGAVDAAAAIAAGRTAPGADVLEAFMGLTSKYEGWKTQVGCTPRLKRAACGAGWADEVAKLLQKLYTSLALEADRKLKVLKGQWKLDHGPLTGPQDERGWHNCEKPCDAKAGQEATLQRQADEEFVAMIYLTYIRSALVQIRNRVGTAAGLYILLLWALTGYPWMNRHGILLQMSALLGLLAVVTILIYAEMQKDDILSRTTQTEAGKLDSQFFTKILSVVGIPALTLLASQFPEFSNLIFSWIEPGLSSMR